MRYRLLFLLLAVILLAACNPAYDECSDPLGCMEYEKGESILIGLLASLHGPRAEAGNAVLEDIQAAIANINLVQGHEVELTWVGTDCTRTEAIFAATQLTTMDSLLAIIGPTCTEDIPFALPILQNAGLAVVLPENGGEAALLDVIQAIQQVGMQDRNKRLIIPRTSFFTELGILP